MITKWACLALALVLVTCGVVRGEDEPVAPLTTSSLIGEWEGEWLSPRGYVFQTTLQLEVEEDGTTSGTFHWTLTASPAGPLQSKVGQRGIEYAKGKFHPKTRTLELAGYEKEDPEEILGLDKYRLVVSDDAQVLGGITWNHGTWRGLLSLKRLDPDAPPPDPANWAGGAVGTGRAPWEKLIEEKGNFSISMPGPPSKQEDDVETRVGVIHAVFYVASIDDGKVEYAAAFSDYPKNFIATADVSKVLQGVRDGSLKTHAGVLTSETKLKLENRYPGLEVTFKGFLDGNRKKPMKGHVRIYLVNTRLYQLIVLSETNGNEVANEDIGRFLYSFERLNK
ncbi:MAG: hypothetical protein KDA76_03270 [Planctomycetaceae bacterium]|nr:hypothetical protein [Planctomycetaceae bacterium]